VPFTAPEFNNMYSKPRQQGPLRQRDIDSRDGTAEEFVVRYEQAAQRAVRGGPAALDEFLPHILDRIADFRNLRVAWSYVARQPDSAPGPDGRRAQDYCADEVHEVLRSLEHAIRSGQLQAGLERVVQIPKGPGREGTRPLSLLNIPDRVVQRAVVQMMQPLLDPQFDPHSFGGRPHMSSWQALARGCVLAEREGRRVWVAADLANFYTNIPLGRLWPVVHRYLPNDEVLALLQQLTLCDHRRGLAQGAPLSTLLANLYAHHFLDRPWRKNLPTVPLLRYVDDLLVTAASVEEANHAHAVLQQRVRDAGLRLKATEHPIRELAAGEHVDWLGYRITCQDGRVRLELPPSRVSGEPCGALLDNLRASLELTHEKPDSALRALQVFDGMIAHAGPCLPSMQKTDRHNLYGRMTDIAAGLGFEEVPIYLDFKSRWRTAYERWRRVRRKANEQVNRSVQQAAGINV
jgi:hypothetical protein